MDIKIPDIYDLTQFNMSKSPIHIIKILYKDNHLCIIKDDITIKKLKIFEQNNIYFKDILDENMRFIEIKCYIYELDKIQTPNDNISCLSICNIDNGRINCAYKTKYILDTTYSPDLCINCNGINLIIFIYESCEYLYDNAKNYFHYESNTFARIITWAQPSNIIHHGDICITRYIILYKKYKFIPPNTKEIYIKDINCFTKCGRIQIVCKIFRLSKEYYKIYIYKLIYMKTEYEICVFNNNNTPKTSFHKYSDSNISYLKTSIWREHLSLETNTLKSSIQSDCFYMSPKTIFNFDSQMYIDIYYDKYPF